MHLFDTCLKLSNTSTKTCWLPPQRPEYSGRIQVGQSQELEHHPGNRCSQEPRALHEGMRVSAAAACPPSITQGERSPGQLSPTTRAGSLGTIGSLCHQFPFLNFNQSPVDRGLGEGWVRSQGCTPRPHQLQCGHHGCCPPHQSRCSRPVLGEQVGGPELDLYTHSIPGR